MGVCVKVQLPLPCPAAANCTVLPPAPGFAVGVRREKLVHQQTDRWRDRWRDRQTDRERERAPFTLNPFLPRSVALHGADRRRAL